MYIKLFTWLENKTNIENFAGDGRQLIKVNSKQIIPSSGLTKNPGLVLLETAKPSDICLRIN